MASLSRTGGGAGAGWLDGLQCLLLATLLCASSGAWAAEDFGPGASIPGRTIVLNGVGYHVGDQGKGDKVVLMLRCGRA